MANDLDPSEVESSEIECPNCGEHVYYEVLVCPRCGLHFYPTEEEDDNRPARTSVNMGLVGWLQNLLGRFTRK